MGLVDREGTGETNKSIPPAVGMETWGMSPLIFYSDDNLAFRITGAVYNSFMEMDKKRYEARNWWSY